jgi:uncharacterized protein YprB with RNaseH-like and TPR domain
VIESTFLHLPRTGLATEERLWRAGVRSWKHFLRETTLRGFPVERKRACDGIIVQSQRALATADSAYFLSLPSTQHWRLFESFSDEAVYVDIETSWRGDVTVLGIYDGKRVMQFVRGVNLTPDVVRKHLEGKLIVTYNGASFDLPVLRGRFGDVVPAVPHFDTMHLARRLGYRGGLKALERDLGIARPSELDGMSGADALTLWDAYRKTGDETHLKTLLAYNEEDIVNLERVAKMLVKQATPPFLLRS